MERREFLKNLIVFIPVGGLALSAMKKAGAKGERYNPEDHLYGMGIHVDRCIGCRRCLEACKIENDVPKDPFHCRTWVERYVIKTDGKVVVENIEHDHETPGGSLREKDILRTFFVPKLCNHCAHPPCVQVCPVGATFSTKDGVTLVDSERCIGCRYCIQACPYGARYIHPKTQTADKCTFCYHRIVKGLLPACVEVCPTQARIFGDVKSLASPLTRFKRMNKIHVLKPGLNTEPKVSYADLDGEVR